MSKVVDLTGSRFGYLIAIERKYPRHEGQAFRWICKCDCGMVRDYNYASLTTGKTKSCGLSCPMKVHPLRGTPTETSWRKLLSRVKYYEGYRDVSVCDRWNPATGGSFENFIEDMGARPWGCSLNRVRGAKIYSKETCEWATLSVQSFDQKLSSDNTSGRTGVKWRKDRGKWEAEIKVERNTIRLYYGDSFEEACEARDAAELKYYGFVKE